MRGLEGTAVIDPVISITKDMSYGSFAFLIKHSTSTHRYATFLFDLATFMEGAKQLGCIMEVEKDDTTMLRENEQNSTSVGGTFSPIIYPRFPTVRESRVDERAWKGRLLNEINFEKEGQGLKIGKFDPIKFYRDGGFYLLDMPGHAIGHISALARTTIDPPTFMFMDGDIAHHGVIVHEIA
ncbi:hypothetical protein COCMIDRAFT_41198 [Bipolaris oryzae ATCC 44560]|uniref:Metallo-beta-lactamase domain-containing protein n=1 Tax=Bipolaris oryzae ATCC 44560 TaxID=930090 RepID=W6YY36_COCMI|nr:uncharacterized protein COCMIDRAFT_41198 [Bipolaris oryzae ATCC 44560]EUC40474.1 hypothetical protein COCMIDRAFT_41198 [Bipolaris oryzae ATCC 44560]